MTPWVTRAAIAGGGLLALGAGVVLPPDAYLGLVALAFVLCAAWLGLNTQLSVPFLGLVVLLATAVAFPYEFRAPGGVRMGSSLPLASVICGIWMLRVAVLRSERVEGSRVVYAVGAFLAIAMLSFLVGQYPFFPTERAPLPAQIVELALFVVSALLFLATAHQITSLRQLQCLTWIFLAAGLVACLVQVTPAASAVGYWTTRPGTIGSLFWTWLAAMAFAQGLLNRRLPLVVRLCLLGLVGLVLFHGLYNVRSWASGWVPVVSALGVIVFVALPRASVATGLLVGSVGLFFANDLWTVLLAEENYSLMTRQEAWRVLWAIFLKNPLLGTGLANYYYYTENYPILGWYVRFISHNNYQDLLIQTGVLGLMAFLWFAGECLLMLVRLLQRVPAGFARAYVVGVIGGLAGSLLAGMLGDWIVPFYYNGGVLGFRSSLLFWVFLGGALALKRVTARGSLVRQVERDRDAAPPVFYGRRLAGAR